MTFISRYLKSTLAVRRERKNTKQSNKVCFPETEKMLKCWRWMDSFDSVYPPKHDNPLKHPLQQKV
jgi:hypothetical protein